MHRMRMKKSLKSTTQDEPKLENSNLIYLYTLAWPLESLYEKVERVSAAAAKKSCSIIRGGASQGSGSKARARESGLIIPMLELNWKILTGLNHRINGRVDTQL